MSIHPDFDDETLLALIAEFLDESAVQIEIFGNRCLEYDTILAADPNTRIDVAEHVDGVNELFRAAHTLKGASSMLGLSNVTRLTHRLENLLEEVRSGRLELTVPILETLLQSLDRLEAILQRVRQTQTDSFTPDDERFVVWLDEAGRSGFRNLLNLGVEGGKPMVEDASLPSEESDAEIPSVATPTPRPAGADEESAFDMSKYLQLYLDETNEELDALNVSLLALEQDPMSKEALTEVFRMAHRIKGSSTAMGFEPVSRLTHELESYFDQLRNGQRTVLSSQMSQVFHCVDALREYHDGLRRGTTVDLTPSLNELTRLLHAPNVEDTEAQTPAEDDAPPALAEMETASDDDVEAIPCSVDASGEAPPDNAERVEPDAITGEPAGPVRCVTLRIQFEPGLSMSGLKAELVASRVESCGTIVQCDPERSQWIGIDVLEAFTFTLQSSAPLELLRTTALVTGVANVDVSERDVATVEDSSQLADDAPRPAEETVPAVAEMATESSEPVVQVANAEVVPPTVAAPPPIRAEAADPIQARPKSNRSDSEANLSTASAPPSARSMESRKPAEARPERSKDVGRPAPASSQATTPKPNAPADASAPKVAETLRVEIERLDHLMNLAGELVINKARFVQIVGSMQEVFRGKSTSFLCRDAGERLASLREHLATARDRSSGDPDLDLDALLKSVHRLEDDLRGVRDEVERIQLGRQQFHQMAEAIHQLNRVSDGIQRSVMDTRMVPVEPLFVRFKRVIRDICREIGREVHLEIAGEKTELDKRMIDELGDPLIHMVRNSVDHGIEPPEQRLKMGKPRAGTIRLEALHRGNSVVIHVSDDGRGINVDKVRAKAIDKGLLTETEAAQFSDKQIVQFIWHPGLTTADKVTDISGRGMGMDIVKSKIEELNGTVDIRTQPGVGTTFAIRLPLTLAIMPSLLARVYDEVFAMPLETVEEIVSVRPADIHTVHGKRAINVRGRIIALVRLDDMFLWAGGRHPRFLDPPTGAETQRRDQTVVIVQSNEIRVGLEVDHLLGEDEIVVKSLAENFMNVKGLAGASILGNGRVSLILDVGAMVELLAQPARLSA